VGSNHGDPAPGQGFPAAFLTAQAEFGIAGLESLLSGMGGVIMDVSMDVFVNQFACFLPMTERHFDVLAVGPWRSLFGEELAEALGGQPFEAVHALGRILEA
jgi:hypothetical protein